MKAIGVHRDFWQAMSSGAKHAQGSDEDAWRAASSCGDTWRAASERGDEEGLGRGYGRGGERHGHRHGRHGRHRGGPGSRGWDFPFGGFGAGPGGFGPRGRGRKARRGDIRTAALLLLAEEQRNGYQIMQEVEQRSGGVWRPSPGSVYPALQQLEDEGLIRSEETDGRKLFQLTDAGRDYVNERGKDRPAPWDEMSSDFGEKAFELGNLMKEVGFAFFQVMRTGSDTQVEEARKVLASARKDLYRILADGDEEGGAEETE
ncbi:MAG TPA: PadR family transcriptional regulator [Solirubrobacteraceae bacterium]